VGESSQSQTGVWKPGNELRTDHSTPDAGEPTMTDHETDQENTFLDPLYSPRFPVKRVLWMLLSSVLILEAVIVLGWNKRNPEALIVPPLLLGLIFTTIFTVDWWRRRENGPRTQEEAQRETRFSHWLILGMSLLMLCIALFQLVVKEDRGRDTFVLMFLGLCVVLNTAFLLWRRTYRWVGLRTSEKKEFLSTLVAAVFSLIVTTIAAWLM
jgi:hypothetical protein